MATGDGYLGGGEILERARGLAAKVREEDLASHYDEARSLPAELVERLRATGVFRMCMPADWGGPEMTAMEQVEVIEALSMADASLGWCSFIWTDSGLYAGYLDEAAARAMYPRLDMATSGWVYPVGQAKRVDGGFLLSGRWMFGSGCDHCDWLVGGCLVFGEGGELAMRDDGMPEWRILMAPRDAYAIEDTWYTTGLRGTGSKHYNCADVFVPEEHGFTFMDAPRRDGPLWRHPNSLVTKMSGVPLGVARDALDRAIADLEGKTDRMTFVPYRDMPRVRTAIAENHARLGAARSYVFSALEAQWSRLERHETPTDSERADVWLSRVNAFQTARQIVLDLYDTIGGSAVFSRDTPYDRHLRDLQTACQHVMAATKGWEDIGALLLGAEATHPML